MEFFFIENAETRYGWGPILLEMLKQGTARVRVRSSIVQKEKKGTAGFFLPLKMLK